MFCTLLLLIVQVPEIPLPFPANKSQGLVPNEQPAPTVQKRVIPLDTPSESERRLIAQVPKIITENWEKKTKAEYQAKVNWNLAMYKSSYQKAYYDHMVVRRDVSCFITRAQAIAESCQSGIKAAQKDCEILLKTRPFLPDAFTLPIVIGSAARFPPVKENKITEVQIGKDTLLKMENALVYVRKLGKADVFYYVCTGAREVEGQTVYILDKFNYLELGPSLK